MFRNVYTAASAFTTSPSTHGGSVKSNNFRIRRGVLQGDITSPIYFILALEYVLRLHDSRTDGVSLLKIVVHTLGYADDLALVDKGGEDMSETIYERITSISRGSREDADTNISLPKTKVLHVSKEEKLPTASSEAAAKQCKFVCENPGCGHVFLTTK